MKKVCPTLYCRTLHAYSTSVYPRIPHTFTFKCPFHHHSSLISLLFSVFFPSPSFALPPRASSYFLICFFFLFFLSLMTIPHQTGLIRRICLKYENEREKRKKKQKRKERNECAAQGIICHRSDGFSPPSTPLKTAFPHCTACTHALI